MIQTIFLATDGRHHGLGRGEIEPSEHFLEAVQRDGTRGWIATMRGKYGHGRKVSLTRIRSVNGADDSQWDAAEAAFQSIGRGVIPAGVPTIG